MRILVVGGTRFVGRHLVAEAVGRGHEVTVVHRGLGCTGAPPARHLHADRDADLSVLSTGRWDATIDTCAYWPRQVASLADALADRGGRHLLISTVSVYSDASAPGLDETAALQPAQGLDGDEPPITPATYGPLKVGCEQVAAQRHAGGLLIVRPTFVVGPHDATGRFPYWVARLSRGGQVLLPGVPQAPFQFIDVRDLASFGVRLLERGEAGTFHAMAPPPFTWADLVGQVAAAVAPTDLEPVWVGSRWLTERGITGADLPLWTGSDDPEFVLAMDPARALGAGLRVRPLADTARDTADWLAQRTGPAEVAAPGLSAERERELLDAWRTEVGLG